MKYFLTRIGAGLIALTIIAAIVAGVVVQPWWIDYVSFGAITLLMSFVIGVILLDT